MILLRWCIFLNCAFSLILMRWALIFFCILMIDLGFVVKWDDVSYGVIDDMFDTDYVSNED